MKKFKLILPIVCSGTTLLSVGTALTSCNDPEQETKVLRLINGETNLISGMEDGHAIAGAAWQPWIAVDENGEIPDNVYYQIQPISGDFNTIWIGKTDGYVRWSNDTQEGTYKFRVSASYYDEKEEVKVSAVSDVITLEVTSQFKVRIPQGDRATCDLISTNDGTMFILRGFEFVNVTGVPFEAIKVIVADDPILGKVGNNWSLEPEALVEYSYAYEQTNLIGYFSNDDLEIGEHKIHVTILNDQTQQVLVNNQEFAVTSSFSTDSWENVAKQAKKGLNHLKEYYGVKSFAGLTRTVTVNGLKHQVMVVGENEDIDENGKKVPLTFQFLNVICDEEGHPLKVKWNNTSTSQLNYWESNINDALVQDGIYENWYLADGESAKEWYGYQSSLINMIPQTIQSNMKSIKRKVLTYDASSKSYKATQESRKLFIPTMNSSFSDKGIINSTDAKYFVKDEIKQLYASEDNQYSYYKNLIGDTVVYNRRPSRIPFTFNPVDSTYYDLNVALATPTTTTSEIFAISMSYDSSLDLYVNGTVVGHTSNELCSLAPMFGI